MKPAEIAIAVRAIEGGLVDDVAHFWSDEWDVERAKVANAVLSERLSAILGREVVFPGWTHPSWGPVADAVVLRGNL